MIPINYVIKKKNRFSYCKTKSSKVAYFHHRQFVSPFTRFFKPILLRFPFRILAKNLSGFHCSSTLESFVPACGKRANPGLFNFTDNHTVYSCRLHKWIDFTKRYVCAGLKWFLRCGKTVNQRSQPWHCPTRQGVQKTSTPPSSSSCSRCRFTSLFNLISSSSDSSRSRTSYYNLLCVTMPRNSTVSFMYTEYARSTTGGESSKYRTCIYRYLSWIKTIKLLNLATTN